MPLDTTPRIAASEIDLDRIAAKVAARFSNRPVAMLAAAARDPLAFLDASGFGDDAPDAYTSDGDVGIVTVSGPLLHEAFSICGFTLADGYDAIGARTRSAFASDKIGALQVHINSPGGVCVGGHELMLEWREMAKASGKPLDVWVNGSAYSMAMWLSSGAGEIFLPPSAGVGSIGVVSMDVNISGALAAENIVPIVAADPEEKVYAFGAELLPPQKEQRDRMQAEVSAMMDLFADAVADGRGIAREQVRAFKARTFLGQAAVEANLADAVLGRRAAIERTRGKIKRKAYSMPNDKSAPAYGSALIRLLGLEAGGNYTAEDIERAASSREVLAELGVHALRETGATNAADAKEILGIYKASHAELPAVRNELATREVQFAVATGRILPKDAFGDDAAAEREYPHLPALHPDLAGKSAAVLRARFASSSAAPVAMKKPEPRKASVTRALTDEERAAVKRSGMTDEEYAAHLAKYGSDTDRENEE